MPQTPQSIEKRLFALQDKPYAAFTAKLVPNIDSGRVIGVRLPQLRALAKEFAREDCSAFLAALPHRYLEEDHLHSFLIAGSKDFEQCMAQIERFLPFIDNWATCDSLRPACFKKHKAALLPYIQKWLQSDMVYTVRFAIGMLMCHYLDEDFEPEYLQWVAAVESEEYYINMMRAWYFATALAKQYESALPLIKAQTLDKFTQNKAIQKARESYRVDGAAKEHLKQYKMR
ncbi:MAG: DNA alkylation repair protein [Ruminococcaceae bacterium]|nr:DNA alkylation repair protein [Oscillospiraceae bacterium]